MVSGFNLFIILFIHFGRANYRLREKNVQDNNIYNKLFYTYSFKHSVIFLLLIILIHNSGKNSIKLLKFNLIHDLNTNGGELVQLLGLIVVG